MKKLKQIIFLIAVGTALTLASCKKEIVQNQSTTPAEKAITNINGILKFKDTETFDKTLGTLSKFNQQEAVAWEKSYNFVSQKNLFDKIVDAETKYEAAARQINYDEAMKLPHHSEVYFKYLKSGLIKEIGDGYNYSICSGEYASVVNEQGLVIIGNEICQLTSTGVKKITNGDLNKIPLLLLANKTDEANNIVIQDLKVEHKRGDFDFHRYGISEVGKRRVEFWHTFISDLGGGGADCYVRHVINVQCREKNIWGSWQFQATWTNINGSWTTYERLYSGQTNNYWPTYHRNELLNNFWVSVNIIDGSEASSNATFIHHAPSGNNYWWEYQVAGTNWSATAFTGITAYPTKDI